MCNIALHWTAHITTVQCNNLFIHSDLVSLAVCTLTVATCMHPYTAKFPFLHIIFQYIFCMYFYSKMVKFCEQINFHDISVFFSILVMCFKLGPSAFFYLFSFLVLDRVDNVFAALTIHYMVGCKKHCPPCSWYGVYCSGY